MKKAFCLLLCLLMLFCSACAEELPVTDPDTEFQSKMIADSFYTSGGDTYNTYVRIEAAAQQESAPVSSLSATIYNDTDYILVFNFHLDKGYSWEKWNGERWIAYSHEGETGEGVSPERAPLYPGPHYIMPHSSHARTDDFSAHPLEAGLYRLRMEYKLTNETKDFSKGFATPGVPCVVEVCLTVSAETSL